MSNFNASCIPFYRLVEGHTPIFTPRCTSNTTQSVLSAKQIRNLNYYSSSMQLEQEMWLVKHPEVIALMKIMVAENLTDIKKASQLKKIALKFMKTPEELEAQIRKILNLEPNEPYSKFDIPYEDLKLTETLLKLDLQEEPLKLIETPPSTPYTESSSFLSIVTSAMTLPTPEPEPEQLPTIAEIFYQMVSTTVDKAIYSGVSDAMLRYDTAYVELMKAIERAMEIPVIPIREEIAIVLQKAYTDFIAVLDEKAFIAAQIAWERRMRKKLKKTLRYQKNFRGYETPPTPKSLPSYHPSYEKPMWCKCHPPYNYNRYPKDRFGIYLPPEVEYNKNNVTLLSASMERLVADDAIKRKGAKSADEGEKQ